MLVIRNKRNPLIAKTSDPGKYNAYETNYPPPQKPKKVIDPKIFDDIEEAEKLEFSEQEANGQISTYEKLWQAKMNAEEKLSQAKKQGIAEATIKSLEAQLATAIAAYDKFIAPEPDPATTEEPEGKELIHQTPLHAVPKPKSEPVAQEPQTTPTATIVTKKPEDTKETNSQEDDPYKGLYADDQDDPYKDQYAEDK